MKKLISILIAIAIICSSFTGCGGGKEIVMNAEDFVDVQVSGISSKAEAVVTKNEESLNIFADVYRADEKDSDKAYKFLKALQSIKYKVLSEDHNLSNGDEIKIEIVYDEAAFSDAKIKIENPEFTYTVSGLDEAIPLDPFAEIEIVYEGISPEAQVKVYNRSEKQFIRDIRYEVEPEYFLRIGDKITVTAKVDTDKAESNGFLVPDNLTKEFTVENIDEYVKDYNEIDQATINQMKDEAAARIAKALSNRYSSVIDVLDLFRIGEDLLEDTKFDEPELIHIYFAYLKPGVSFANINNIYYLYKITAHYADESEPRIAYISVPFKDVVKKVDGKIEINTKLLLSESPLNSVSKELDAVISEAITTQKGSYEIQEITP